MTKRQTLKAETIKKTTPETIPATVMKTATDSRISTAETVLQMPEKSATATRRNATQ